MNLQEFRDELSRIKSLVSEDQLEDTLCCILDIKRHELPLFPATNLVEEDYIAHTYTFDGKIYKQNLSHDFEWHELIVDPTICIGTTWLFRNDRTEGRPVPGCLARCLYLPAQTAPPVPAIQLGDWFMCNDGNHRIYAAYLLGRKVKIVVENSYPLISKG